MSEFSNHLVIAAIWDIFDPFFELIAGVLAWIYEQPIIGGSFGVAIIILTLIVMTLLSPLTIRATKSSLRMQKLQPEIVRVQKEFKNDREQMNQEIFALYKDNGVNPAGACLPLLFQSPVFIILYNVIRGLTRRSDGEGGKYERTFDPNHLGQEAELRSTLEQNTTMDFWGVDLAISARDALQDFSFITALPFLALIGAVTATSYYQQRQISGRSTNTEINPQQKMLLRIMPPFFAIISFTFPAALVLYFLTSNVFRVAQQGYITRALYGEKGTDVDPIVTSSKDDASSGGKGSGSKGSGGKSSDKSDTKGSDGKASGTKESGKKASGTNGSSSKNGNKSRSSSGSGSTSGRIGRTRLDPDELPPQRKKSSGGGRPSSSGRVTPSKRTTASKDAPSTPDKTSKKKKGR